MFAPMGSAKAQAPADVGRRHCVGNSEWEEITATGVGRRHVRLRTTPIPRTAGGPEGEAAPSIRGTDSVLAGTALRTHGPKRGAAVFHCHALNVPRRSFGPALQAVYFDSVRRCAHRQLLYRLASNQLWPTRLPRSRTSFGPIVTLKCTGRPTGLRHPRAIAL